MHLGKHGWFTLERQRDRCREPCSSGACTADTDLQVNLREAPSKGNGPAGSGHGDRNYVQGWEVAEQHEESSYKVQDKPTGDPVSVMRWQEPVTGRGPFSGQLGR